jgi:hypothetical protein
MCMIVNLYTGALEGSEGAKAIGEGILSTVLEDRRNMQFYEVAQFARTRPALNFLKVLIYGIQENNASFHYCKST